MPQFESMQEYVWEAGTWQPACAWVFEHGGIVRVVPLPGYDQLAKANEQAVIESSGMGFSYDDIWAYWAAQGGRGQTTLRTTPEPYQADSLPDALAHALATLRP